MTTETFDAWILHKRLSGDTSTQITFFTREKGIVSCLCKGGRTPKKQAILQAFTPLWLSVELRKEWYYARQFESTALSLDIKGHALFAGLYINELLYLSLRPFDPHPDLYDAYLETLYKLVMVTDNLAIEVLLRRLEWMLLLACGQAISFTEGHSRKKLVEDGCYQFTVHEGFIPTSTGLLGKDILAFAEGRVDEVAVLKTAKFIMRRAIDHLLGGKPLKSRALYGKV